MDRRRDLCLILGWNVENSEVKPVAWTDRRITRLRTQTHTHTHVHRNTQTWTLFEVAKMNRNNKEYVKLC